MKVQDVGDDDDDDDEVRRGEMQVKHQKGIESCEIDSTEAQ